MKLPSFFLLLGMLLTSFVATAANVQQGPLQKLEKPRGQLQAYYDSSASHCCNAVVMLNVGTAMAVSAYSDIATSIVQQSPGVVAIIMDTNPGSFWRPTMKKQDGTKYVDVSNAIANNISSLVPNSCCTQQPRDGYFIGGHSGGGEGAVHALASNDLEYSVAGFIGLDPFKIIKDEGRKKMNITVPSLTWGFSKTSCFVTREEAGLAAYNISPKSSRVFYNVETNNDLHCSFTDSGCKGLCSGQPEDNWIRKKAVGESVQKFTSAVTSSQTFSRHLFEIEQAEVDLYVNTDTVLPKEKQRKTSPKWRLSPALAY